VLLEVEHRIVRQKLQVAGVAFYDLADKEESTRVPGVDVRGLPQKGAGDLRVVHTLGIIADEQLGQSRRLLRPRTLTLGGVGATIGVIIA